MNASQMDDVESLGPPLVRRLIETCDATWVDETTVQQWADQQNDAIVLLAGDARRFPEGQDVAVVLPELRRSFPGRFSVAIVPRANEDKVARLFGVLRWPSLVFLRAGGYVTTLSGMLDWEVFLQEVSRALILPASRAPTVGIPVVSAGERA